MCLIAPLRVWGVEYGTRTFEVTDEDLEALFAGVMVHLDQRQRRNVALSLVGVTQPGLLLSLDDLVEPGSRGVRCVKYTIAPHP